MRKVDGGWVLDLGAVWRDGLVCAHVQSKGRENAPLADPGGGHGAAGRVHRLAIALCISTLGVIGVMISPVRS